DTRRAFSAKAEAHWLMACSEAPAQTISSASTQKRPLWNRAVTDSCWLSSTVRRMGTRAKATALAAGSTAQPQATQGQQSRPNTAKQAVDRAMTATQPQQ